MGTTERRAREKKELRQRIIDAATQLFVTEGYANVSMRKVAEKIEYAPSTIYLHFRDKAALVGSICEETFQGLDEELEKIRGLGLPPLTTLRRSLRQYIDFGLSHPNHYLVTFCIPEAQHGHDNGEAHAEVLQVGLKPFERLREGLRICMEMGEIRKDDVEATAQSVWAMIHGVTSILITCRSFPFIDRTVLIESALDKIMRGLR